MSTDEPLVGDDLVDADASPDAERLRRWRLALGEPSDREGLPSLSDEDQRMSDALSQLYGGSGGFGRSTPRIAKWLGDVREFFPTPVVQIVQRDAIERHGLTQLLLEPELLSTIEPDVNLVADLIALRHGVPEASKDIARQVVAQVVDALMRRLEARTRDAVHGAVRQQRRTRRPRFVDIDWHRTVLANLRHYQADYRTVVPETLIGYARGHRHMDEVIMLVDQSGSMAPSVVYASIFAAVMASVPAVRTKLVCFDTEVVDLTEELADPVDVLFGIQLGGGTDIDMALGYVQQGIAEPQKTHLVLISDLYENGDPEGMISRARQLVDAGVNVIVLLALSDEGRPSYDSSHAATFAAMGCPVFACTPDRFPDLMAAALSRRDLGAWAAESDIALVRATEE